MYGQFMPLVLIQKTAMLSSTQVDALLPNSLKAMKADTLTLTLLLIGAGVLVLVGAGLCFKARQLKQAADAAPKDAAPESDAPQDKQNDDSSD